MEYQRPTYQFPARKPIVPPKNLTINPNLNPQMSYAPPQLAVSPSHSRRRTSSSGVFPPPAQYAAAPQNVYSMPFAPGQMKRRTDSTSTATTGSQERAASIYLRRSGSTNTQASAISTAPNAYVATLRRQKATVWCDRSQPEDARLIAAQKAAKLRAAMEVVGSSASTLVKGSKHGVDVGNGSATSSVRGGKNGKLGRGASHLTSGSAGIGTGSVVGGPPTRLYLGDSSDEEDSYIPGPGIHRRHGSGNSSNSNSNSNSNRRRSNRASMLYSEHRNSSHGALQRNASNGSSSSYSPNTSVPELSQPQIRTRGKGSPPSLVSPHIMEETTPELRQSNDYFKGVDKDTLKRRGSVDETEARTMTMSGLRLVVANPD